MGPPKPLVYSTFKVPSCSVETSFRAIRPIEPFDEAILAGLPGWMERNSIQLRTLPDCNLGTHTEGGTKTPGWSIRNSGFPSWRCGIGTLLVEEEIDSC